MISLRKTWTEKEVDFIKNNLSKMDLKTMANVLNVNYLKLIDKIHKLGLNSKKEKGILWTEQEDVRLKKHFEFAPKNYLLKLFPNRTWNSIFQRGCKKYNLKRKPVWTSIGRPYLLYAKAKFVPYFKRRTLLQSPDGASSLPDGAKDVK